MNQNKQKQKNYFRRHDLVFLKEGAAIHRVSDPMAGKLLSQGVPAIVKMQTGPAHGNHLLELGLSSWERADGQRIRCSFSIAPKDVRRRIRPWEALMDILRKTEETDGTIAEDNNGLYRKHKQISGLLREISQQAARLGLLPGVYGSAALEGITGMPYLHGDSDLDLYFLPQKAFSEEELTEFYCRIRETAIGWSLTADCEISIGKGYSVKLSELVSGQKTVLAKGFHDVILMERRAAIRQQAEIYGRLDGDRFQRKVVEAVICEARSGPKPGLVDRYNQGAHQDMDLQTFIASATALGPYFRRCFSLGIERAAEQPEALFQMLRPLGIEAERAMLEATNGVNTHKGLIFSLGLLSCAFGRYAALAERGEEDGFEFGGALIAKKLLRFCASLVEGSMKEELAKIADRCRFDPEETTAARKALDPEDESASKEKKGLSHGERLYLRYGVTGIRGVALDGYRQVWQVAYPLFCSRMAEGYSTDQSAVDTLLALIPLLEDTNLLHRGGPEGLARAKEMAEKAVSLGGMTTEAGRQFIWQMDRDFMEQRLSPGGAADLLAMTLVLYSLLHDA